MSDLKCCACSSVIAMCNGQDCPRRGTTRMPEKPRCTITGNPCLTDTWALDSPPDCHCGRIVRSERETRAPAPSPFILWGHDCAACGQPVRPPMTRYQKPAVMLGDKVWHGECVPENASGSGHC